MNKLVQNAQNGAPVGNSKIIIRCSRAMESSNSPLIVIDGVPTDSSSFKKIDPQQIENIFVLKQSAASAIYGSAAFRGAIVINLKKAKKCRFTILDESDSLPVSRATIHFKSAFHNLTVVSDEKGEVIIPSMIKGYDYSMELTHIGYEGFSRTVKFNADNQAATLSLKKKVNALAEVIIRSSTCVRCGFYCTGCSVCVYKIGKESRLANESTANAFVIYPNPVTKGNVITIVSPKSMIATYSIASVSGQILKTGKVVANEKLPFQVTTGNWPSGNYFITLSDENSQTKYTQKFIIQ